VPLLLGEAFREAVHVMATIMWSALFMALSGVFWTWLIAAGRPGSMSISTIVASIATVVLVIPMAQWKGLSGAALAVVIASALGLATAGAMAARHLPLGSQR
jgi:O-antigen/teichoic acid export membrane protein